MQADERRHSHRPEDSRRANPEWVLVLRESIVPIVWSTALCRREDNIVRDRGVEWSMGCRS
jgi:hypothetical protein